MNGDGLQRLASGAETLVRDNEPFLRGEAGHEYLDEEEVEEYVEDVSFADEVDADLEGLEERLREIQADYNQGVGAMDTEAAVAVRRHVEMTRAQAADSGIWHDLSVRKYPWFVRHRWSYEGRTAMKKKFWTQGAPLDSESCTFERLWWIAELTHSEKLDDPYRYTRQAFSARRFVLRVFDIQMGRYAPAAHALVEVLYDEGGDGDEEEGFPSNDDLDAVIKRFRKSGAAMPYEGREKQALVESVERIKREVVDD